jgi:hypothetical protein
MRTLHGPLLHGIHRAECRDDLACAEHTNLELAAGDGRHTLGNDFTATVNRIQALREAGSATPANLRQTLRLCNRWCCDGSRCCARTGTRQKFSSIHDELPLLTSKNKTANPGVIGNHCLDPRCLNGKENCP